MNLYVSTSDKTSFALKAFAHQANKYYKRNWKVLGYSVFPELPSNFECISMKPVQESIENWTRDLYEAIKDDPNEFVGFCLDDFIIIDNFDEEVFNKAMDYMKSNKVGRYEFGYGASQKKPIEMINDLIFKYGQGANYRISTQFSVWNKEYLLRYLQRFWTPWQFEVRGSRASEEDGWDIIGTVGKHCLRVIEESMVSNRHPGMYNVLGIKPKDLEELIDFGYIPKDKIQYGMTKGENPKTLNLNNIGIKYRKFYD